jgi:hypothetical protein
MNVTHVSLTFLELVSKRIRFDALQSISNMLTFAWF